MSSEFALTAAFFESVANPVLLCDPALTILAINEAASDVLGLPAAQLLGRKANEVLASRMAERPETPVPDAGRLQWRCRLEAPLGDPRVVEVSGTPLRDRQHGTQGWALTLKSGEQSDEPPRFLGRSAVVQELLEFVARIAASRAASILLLGESGTGKELIAKRLHCLSSRAAAQFVPVNCATIPENLLETELFGYEKGAFTDARETKPGLLEIAHGGTLFLDEIGELPLLLQAKLLRVLEDRTFRRVGGNRSISVDLRVIGATNTDLEKAIAERRFRSDLYYRLNVVQIRLPALRERFEDIRELAAHFLEQFNRIHHRQIRGIQSSALRALELHAWPGNVRELRNTMERAVLVETTPLITTDSLTIPNHGSLHGVKTASGDSRGTSAILSLRHSEQELVAAALAETAGNQTRAATLLGIGRFSLRYKMKKLGML